MTGGRTERIAARRRRQMFITTGAVLCLALVACVVVVAVGRWIVCARLESALAAAAATALDGRADASAVVSARAAVAARAHETGREVHAVGAILERRAAGVDEGEEHVVVFEAFVPPCHARFEVPLQRPLSADDLHALSHAQIKVRAQARR